MRKLAAAFTLLALCWTGFVSAASPAPFLWQVQGPKAKHFLLGSVHLLPQDAEGLPDGIGEAYDAVDNLVFESDIAALGNQRSTRMLLNAARNDRGLKAQLDAETYAKLQSRIARIGMPAQLCDRYKAWFCALSLEVFGYQRAGFAGQYGLDQQLYNFAHEDGKNVDWFEPPPVHLGLFTDMPESLSKKFLSAALAEDGASGDEPRKLYEAWRDNDVAKIERLVTELKGQYPEVYAHLLANRNEAWRGRLKKLLDGSRSQLIIVGAAHYVGPDGLLAKLKADGYRVIPFVSSEGEQVAHAATRRGARLADAGGMAGTGR